MSYAEAAAKGPKQSPEEARAPILPQVEKTESESTISLVDIDSSHADAAPENQPVKTTRQADRLSREAVEESSEAGREQTARAKPTAGEKPKSVYRYKDNPVFIWNILLITAVSTGLGFGAYKKGRLSWKVVGLWTGAVGVLTAADYFVRKWLIRIKYPNK
jgi:hypothetical protein